MMLEWDEAKNKLGLRWDNELLKLFPKGLQPYSCREEGVEKIGCPYEYHLWRIKDLERKREIRKLNGEKNSSSPDEKKIKKLKASVGKLKDQQREIYKSDPSLQVPYVNGDPICLSWEFYEHPEANKEVKKVLSYLRKGGEVCFKPEDVEKIKNRIIEDPLISDARKEIDKIYEYVKLKTAHSQTSLMGAKPNDLKKYALEAHRKLAKDFKCLKKKHLEEIEVYDLRTQPKREFIGRLLLKCFQDRSLKYSGGRAQELFYRSQKLRGEEK